ncbi:MAG: CHAP domain-containing protein [Clostridia bacterium]|nr:CHAP domain-containing protein [Clostridia bacterium]
MKKNLLLIILSALILASSTSCAKVQSSIATNMIEAAGGTVPDGLEEQIQSDWDEFGNDVKDLGNIIGKDIKDRFKNEIENIFSEKEAEKIAEEISNYDSMTANRTTPADINNSEYYNTKSYKKGQCTWYANGRFFEKNGFEVDTHGNAKEWLDNCTDSRVTVERDPQNIKPNSIAVFSKPADPSHWGHVVYVEYVTYDENGNPENVYFTECNMDAYYLDKERTIINPKWGVYNEGDDCVMKCEKFDYFIARSNGGHRAEGYIIPNE